jgi:hypothetical protein
MLGSRLRGNDGRMGSSSAALRGRTGIAKGNALGSMFKILASPERAGPCLCRPFRA